MLLDLLQEMGITRNGVPLRRDSDGRTLLLMVFLIAIRDGARRLQILHAEDSTTMREDVNGDVIDMVPPPAHFVDLVYRGLSTGPEPWYRRLLRWLRGQAEPRVPDSWRGQIEVRIGRVIVPVACDFLAHPGGRLLAFDFEASVEDIAEVNRMIATARSKVER
jgi:hypothetical protein